jgi:hypothetical protein
MGTYQGRSKDFEQLFSEAKDFLDHAEELLPDQAMPALKFQKGDYYDRKTRSSKKFGKAGED